MHITKILIISLLATIAIAVPANENTIAQSPRLPNIMSMIFSPAYWKDVLENSYLEYAISRNTSLKIGKEQIKWKLGAVKGTSQTNFKIILQKKTTQKLIFQVDFYNSITTKIDGKSSRSENKIPNSYLVTYQKKSLPHQNPIKIEPIDSYFQPEGLQKEWENNFNFSLLFPSHTWGTPKKTSNQLFQNNHISLSGYILEGEVTYEPSSNKSSVNVFALNGNLNLIPDYSTNVGKSNRLSARGEISGNLRIDPQGIVSLNQQIFVNIMMGENALSDPTPKAKVRSYFYMTRTKKKIKYQRADDPFFYYDR